MSPENRELLQAGRWGGKQLPHKRKKGRGRGGKGGKLEEKKKKVKGGGEEEEGGNEIIKGAGRM